MYAGVVLLGLAAVAHAHFVLQIPTSLGFDDTSEDTAPCGSFDPTDRSKGVANWDVNGDNIGVLTTHTSVTWEINAALVSNTQNFVPVVQPFVQTGVGNVCFAGVHGFAAWIGQPAVLQIIQHGPDGVLYQCAAIQFVAGGPDAVPSGCTNSAGVSIAPIIAAPGPSASAPSTPSSPTPSASTTPAPTSSASAASSSSSAASTTTAAPTSFVSSSVSKSVPTRASSATATISAGVVSSSSNLTSSTATASRLAVVTNGANAFTSNSMVVLAGGLMALALAL